MAWPVPPTFATGELVTATKLNGYRDSMNSFGDPTIANTYTPTWTGLSVLGSSQSFGRYWVSGKFVLLRASLTAGGSTSLGTGAIFCSLPLASAVESGTAGWQGVGNYRESTTGTPWRALAIFIEQSATVAGVSALRWTDSGYVSPGSLSYAWAATPQVAWMRFSITYLAA